MSASGPGVPGSMVHLTEDQRLARAGAAKHPAALRTLVGRVTGRLRAVAWHLCYDYHECEDLCQEALVKITSPAVLERYRGGGSIEAYLLTVGVRSMLSIVRTKRARDWRKTYVDEQPEERGAPGVHWEASAGEALDSGLREALLRLPDRARLVVLLIAVADYSYAETAELTGLPVGTVKSAYSRARGALRAALESQSADSAVTT